MIYCSAGGSVVQSVVSGLVPVWRGSVAPLTIFYSKNVIYLIVAKFCSIRYQGLVLLRVFWCICTWLRGGRGTNSYSSPAFLIGNILTEVWHLAQLTHLFATLVIVHVWLQFGFGQVTSTAGMVLYFNAAANGTLLIFHLLAALL